MDVKGQRILIFGDSLSKTGSDNSPEIAQITTGSNRISGQPGDLLGSMLLEAGAEAVQVDARVGRSAANFFGREDAQALLSADASFRPTLVFIVLGTNDIGLNLQADAQFFQQLKDFFEQNNAAVWAIGPFTYTAAAMNIGAQPVVDMMQSVFGRRFIDGRPLSVQEGRAGDGVHFGAQSAAATAAKMLAEIQSAGGILDIKRSWPGLAIGAASVLAGMLAFQWWRKQRSQQLLGDVATPARDFSKDEAQTQFFRLITDDDPAMLDVAEDLALQHELKLSELSQVNPTRKGQVFGKPNGRTGWFNLEPIDDDYTTLADTRVHWRFHRKPFGECAAEFNAFVDGERIGGPADRIPTNIYEHADAEFRSKEFKEFYKGEEDFCRRAATSQAWAVAKEIKRHKAAGLPFDAETMKNVLDQDNSEPAELFGLDAKGDTWGTNNRPAERGTDRLAKELFGLKGKTKMEIGTLVARAEKPDELYRVTSSPMKGWFRLLPHQRQGQEVIISGRGTQWSDGISQFLIQGVEYAPRATKPKRKTAAERKADHEAANTETSDYVKRTFGPK